MSGTVKSDLDPEVERVAQALVDAIEASDVDTWGAIFGEDAVVWHSNENAEMTPATNVEILRGMFTHSVSQLRYLDIRRSQTASGFVQEHTLSLTFKNGVEYQGPVCMVIQVAGGRVRRFHEYIDSGLQTFVRDHVATP